MPASFDTLPPEIRIQIYRHLFADKNVYYLGGSKPNRRLPDHHIPAMLLVSKLHRAEVLATFGPNVPVVVSQVSQIRPMTDLPMNENIRLIRIQMTHHRYKPNSMERVLAKMPALSEVTICGEVTQQLVIDLRLSIFKQRLKMVRFPDIWLDVVERCKEPHCSVVAAFKDDPWCRHLLRGRSALRQRPHIKLYAEVERRMWNDPPNRDLAEPIPVAASPTTRLLHDFGHRGWPDRQEWKFPSEAARYDSKGDLKLHSADPRFVTIVGRMSLRNWIMHWELDGKPFAQPLKQQKFPDDHI